MQKALSSFLREIRSAVPTKNIYTDPLRRFAWGTDGSFYRLSPKAVIRAEDEKEVSALLPDKVTGFGYLEQVKTVLAGETRR